MYEYVGSDVVGFTNKDPFEWTDVRVELWVYVAGDKPESIQNISFTCPAMKGVPSGQLLPIAFRECATPLPFDARRATVSAIHVTSREGIISQAFEPGLIFRK